MNKVNLVSLIDSDIDPFVMLEKQLKNQTVYIHLVNRTNENKALLKKIGKILSHYNSNIIDYVDRTITCIITDVVDDVSNIENAVAQANQQLDRKSINRRLRGTAAIPPPVRKISSIFTLAVKQRIATLLLSDFENPKITTHTRYGLIVEPLSSKRASSKGSKEVAIRHLPSNFVRLYPGPTHGFRIITEDVGDNEERLTCHLWPTCGSLFDPTPLLPQKKPQPLGLPGVVNLKDLDESLHRSKTTNDQAAATGRSNKSRSTATRAEKGYCECCDKYSQDLVMHFKSEKHREFLNNPANFAELDRCCAEDAKSIAECFAEWGQYADADGNPVEPAPVVEEDVQSRSGLKDSSCLYSSSSDLYSSSDSDEEMSHDDQEDHWRVEDTIELLLYGLEKLEREAEESDSGDTGGEMCFAESVRKIHMNAELYQEIIENEELEIQRYEEMQAKATVQYLVDAVDEMIEQEKAAAALVEEEGDHGEQVEDANAETADTEQVVGMLDVCQVSGEVESNAAIMESKPERLSVEENLQVARDVEMKDPEDNADVAVKQEETTVSMQVNERVTDCWPQSPPNKNSVRKQHTVRNVKAANVPTRITRSKSKAESRCLSPKPEKQVAPKKEKVAEFEPQVALSSSSAAAAVIETSSSAYSDRVLRSGRTQASAASPLKSIGKFSTDKSLASAGLRSASSSIINAESDLAGSTCATPVMVNKKVSGITNEVYSIHEEEDPSMSRQTLGSDNLSSEQQNNMGWKRSLAAKPWALRRIEGHNTSPIRSPLPNTRLRTPLNPAAKNAASVMTKKETPRRMSNAKQSVKRFQVDAEKSATSYSKKRPRPIRWQSVGKAGTSPPKKRPNKRKK